MKTMIVRKVLIAVCVLVLTPVTLSALSGCGERDWAGRTPEQRVVRAKNKEINAEQRLLEARSFRHTEQRRTGIHVFSEVPADVDVSLVGGSVKETKPSEAEKKARAQLAEQRLAEIVQKAKEINAETRLWLTKTYPDIAEAHILQKHGEHRFVNGNKVDSFKRFGDFGGNAVVLCYSSDQRGDIEEILKEVDVPRASLFNIDHLM
jgi:hypothetical protein